jgi:hypothetical protein
MAPSLDLIPWIAASSFKAAFAVLWVNYRQFMLEGKGGKHRL